MIIELELAVRKTDQRKSRVECFQCSLRDAYFKECNVFVTRVQSGDHCLVSKDEDGGIWETESRQTPVGFVRSSSSIGPVYCHSVTDTQFL